MALRLNFYSKRLFVTGLLTWVILTVYLIFVSHREGIRSARPAELQIQENNPQSLNIRQNSAIVYPSNSSHVAVLLLACNRPQAVRRSLARLLKYRPKEWELDFPILVSLDCNNLATKYVVSGFSSQLKAILYQPDQKPIKTPPRERRLVGYYYISRHFRWALDQVFVQLKYELAIVVEDDLDISPDFYAYFRHLSPLLTTDPTVWCISAWNDNGKPDLIDARRPDLFHRTDFFPGLGWMLTRKLWLELRPQWPAAYWDDHLRKPSIRKGRVCIRPEVSRSYTFGRVGVSHGQHFDRFLKHIMLYNSTNVNYTRMGVDHLMEAQYDEKFIELVYGLPLAQSVSEALSIVMVPVLPLNGGTTVSTIGFDDTSSVRIQYNSKNSFIAVAKALGIMTDFKHGVPRCGYKGVVSVFKHGRRIFLAPQQPWSGYVTAWHN